MSTQALILKNVDSKLFSQMYRNVLFLKNYFVFSFPAPCRLGNLVFHSRSANYYADISLEILFNSNLCFKNLTRSSSLLNFGF